MDAMQDIVLLGDMLTQGSLRCFRTRDFRSDSSISAKGNPPIPKTKERDERIDGHMRRVRDGLIE